MLSNPSKRLIKYGFYRSQFGKEYDGKTPEEREDILILKEWNPKTKEYTGRKIEKEVTCIVKTKEINFFTKDEIDKYGFQVIALK